MVKRALILVTSILIALPLLMPFNIYGAGETQIVPTYTSSTTQQEWQTKLRINNYCEGTNASTASCKLSFYVNGPYYGIINIEGYDSNGTHWINGGYIFVSDGYGEYNYNFYQNGIKQISSISIWGVQLFQPDSNVDLTQIIQLLTSINNYEQQNNILLDDIVDNTDTVESNQLENIQQIKNVISQLVISNGYLDILTKLRQWNFPIESFGAYNTLLNNSFNSIQIVDYYQNAYYMYPIIQIPSNVAMHNSAWEKVDTEYYLIFGIDKPYLDNYNDYFTFQNCVVTEQTIISNMVNPAFKFVRIKLKNTTGQSFIVTSKTQIKYIPIYFNNVNNKNLSTDFALLWGLSNELLDDLDIITNGTAQSSSAASSSDHANEQLQTDSNTLFNQEDNFKSDMNNAMQNVNTTFRLQDMGTKFVSSAQWVRSQYENLTNNTPFASLITFSLITGLALILLGKVYK